MKAVLSKTLRVLVTGAASLALCFSLVACGPSSNSNSNATNTSSSGSSNTSSSATSNQQSTSQQQTNTSSNDTTTQVAPTITTAYLQEGSFGESNVLAFIVKESEDKVTKMTVMYGSVTVSGNSMTTQNYSTSTVTISDPNASAFSGTFGSSGAGSITGSLVEGEVFTGTINLPGVGEVAFSAGVAESSSCTRCNGSGYTSSFGTSVGSGSSSSACTSCGATGRQIKFHGMYL